MSNELNLESPQAKEENVIKYSTNWNNKLDCDSFTTIRLHSNKYQVGKEYTVNLKGKDLKRVKIVDKKVLLLNDINEFIAQIDTGYSRQKCIDIIKKMYHNLNLNWDTQKIDFILQQTIK